jgi:hypothetical protein
MNYIYDYMIVGGGLAGASAVEGISASRTNFIAMCVTAQQRYGYSAYYGSSW